MKKKRLLTLSILAMSIASLGSLSSCYFTLKESKPSSSEIPGSSSITNPQGFMYRVYLYTGLPGVTTEFVEVPEGSAMPKPADPDGAGREFLGWYLNRQGTGQPFNFNTPITDNMVLYAKFGTVSDEQVKAKNAEWLQKSKPNHLYVHYLRFKNNPEEYKEWDVWSWPYSRDGKQFDFMKDDNGNVVVDELTGACVEIDLTKTYDNAGWIEGAPAGQTLKFTEEDGSLAPQIGFQIVKSATRNDKSKFWENDGDDNFLKTKEARWENGSYHVFAVENNVPHFTYKYSSDQIDNPYDKDDGKSVSESNIKSSLDYENGNSKTSSYFQNNVGVGYQVMVASFADSDGDGMGDIYGLTKKIPYLKNNLHIDTLWLTPVQLSDSYHGYDTIDYKVVDPKFGSKVSPNTVGGEPNEESAMKDYVDLLDLCEENGIKVLMDLVVNHTSKKNVWFLESSQLNPEYRSFYQWKRTDSIKSGKGESWHKYSTTPYSYYGKFASSMPELNYDYQGTRDAMVDVANFWMDKGVDGFRLDAVKHVYMADEVTNEKTDIIVEDVDPETGRDYSSNLTKNINFFQEFNYRVKQKNPNAFIVGENFDGNALENVAPYYQGMDSLFDFYMYFKMSNIAMTDSKMAQAETIANPKGDNWSLPGVQGMYNVNRSKNIPGPVHGGSKAIDSIFTSNHDVPRAMNMMVGTADSADNQVAGVVSDTNAAIAQERAKCYAAVQILAPGVSWIYYGDELGMSSNFAEGEDKNSPHADRWYRQPYKFEDAQKDKDDIYQTGFTFTGGKGFRIDYDEYNRTQLKSAEAQLADSTSMLNFYKKITELKSTVPAFTKGSYTGIPTGNSSVFAFERKSGAETYEVYVNFGTGDATLSRLEGLQRVVSVNATGNTLNGHGIVVVKK